MAFGIVPQTLLPLASRARGRNACCAVSMVTTRSSSGGNVEREGKELVRCGWVGEVERVYHDEEWGRPVLEDRKLFEMLILEGAQAGLSWRTILKRRENYRRAYLGFDPKTVAGFDEEKVEDLMTGQAGIIRHRSKIVGSVRNAQLFLDIQQNHGSFANYLWDFVGGKPIMRRPASMEDVPVRSEEGDALSRDLKARGFKFTGPVIMYSYMQAVGLVNDHVVDCFCYPEVEAIAKSWKPIGTNQV